MIVKRAQSAVILLVSLFTLVLGASGLAAQASAAQAQTDRPGAAGQAAKARARQTSTLGRRLTMWRGHTERDSAVSARGIAGRTRLLEAARTHLAKLQERECRNQLACERKAARIAELEAHIRVTEEHIKGKEQALKTRLARLAHAEQTAEAQLAQL